MGQQHGLTNLCSLVQIGGDLLVILGPELDVLWVRRGEGGGEEGGEGGRWREEGEVGSSLAWPRPFLELLLRKKSALTF